MAKVLDSQNERERESRPEKMLEAKHPEEPSGKQRKVLFFGSEASVRALISTFLITMGWKCVVASNREDLFALIERETFDAVLLDLNYSGGPPEPTILKIKEVRPSLWDKILVISSGSTNAETRELIERHDLVHLSQEVLLLQLWTTLQDLCSPHGSRKSTAQVSQVARMVFDSFRSPLTSEMRSTHPSARQLAYEYKSAMIDVSIESPPGSDRISLAGQVLDAANKKGKHDGLTVVLSDGRQTLARTTTNEFGEFHLEFKFVEEAGLEIRLGTKSWVSVPLGRMNWVNRTSSSKSGS